MSWPFGPLLPGGADLQAGGAAQDLTLPLLSTGESYVAAVNADSPIRYYRMGEPSGSTVNDEIGTADITLVNTPTMGVAGAISGDSNTAISFAAASTEYGTASFSMSGGAFSYECWLKRTANNSNHGLVSFTGGANDTFLEINGPAVGRFRVYSNDFTHVATSSIDITDTNWHHVVVTYDGSGNWKLYIDGVDRTTVVTTSTASPSGTVTFGVGAGGGGYEPLDGSLDEVAVYQSALSGTRIAAHYNAGTGASTGATLYAPTVAQGASTVTLGLLDSGPALYAPTVQPAAAGVTLSLLDAGAALYAPTLAPKSTLTLALLDAGAALYAPTVAPKNTVTLGLLDAGAALYAPTATQTGGAVQSVTLGLLDGGSALYAPTVRRIETWYISPSGSDSTGDGSVGSPWASIDKFLDQSPGPGDTLYCRGGSYGTTGNVSLRAQGLSGNATQPITIRNYPGETPVFHGTGATYTWLLAFQGGSSYWVVDGIETANDYQPTGFGVITLYDGNSSDGGAHHITIRNCRFAWKRYMTQQEHCVYLGADCTFATVEDCRFEGEWQNGDGNGGAGVQIGDHHPDPTDFLIQRCVFTGLSKAIYMYDAGADNLTGSILHNTFRANETHIRADAHYTLLVRDNCGQDAIYPSYNLYDPVDSAYTTADHNYWNQSFVAGTDYPVYGSTALNGASDGSDAGAEQVDYVVLGLLDAGPALYAPTATQASASITLPLLDASPAVYSPTVQPRSTLTLGLLDAGPALYAPTLGPRNTLVLSLLDAGPSLFAPTLAPRSTITLGLLDAGPALYAPEVQPDQFLALVLLDGAGALYAPTVTAVGGGSQSVTLSLLDAGPAVYAPGVQPGPVTATLPLLDAGPAVYAPTVTTRSTIGLVLLDGGAGLYAPSVLPAPVTLSLSLLQTAPTLYAPTMAPAAWTIHVPQLDGGAAVYAPLLSVSGGTASGGRPPGLTVATLMPRGTAATARPGGSASTPRPAGRATHPIPEDA